MNKPIFIIYYQLGLGGIQKKIVDIVNFLAKEKPNLKIYILLRRKTKFNLSKEINNKKAKVVYYPDWLKIRIPFFFPVFIIWHTWKLKPQAILAFANTPALVALWTKLLFLWRRIKVVISEDTSLLPSKQIFAYYNFPSFRNFLIKIFYPFAEVVFTVNKPYIKDLVETYKLPADKVRLISNWTGLVNNSVLSVPKKYDLIYIGRLVGVKNVGFLLEGVKKLKKNKSNIKLCIVGEGEEERDLKTWTRKNKLEKNVLFFKPKINIENYLAQAKIFVQASKSEGLSIAALEAMALRIPIVSSDYLSAKEIIKDGKTGFIYKNLDGFVEVILDLLENESLRKNIGRQARDYVKKYHSLKNINRYLEALGAGN